MKFHSKGNALLAGSEDSTIWLWNCKNGKLISNFYGHSDGITDATFTPNGFLTRKIYQFYFEGYDLEIMESWQNRTTD